MLIDAHAHLDGYADRDEVIARARAAGIIHVVAVGQWREGAGMAGAQDAIALAKTDRSFFSATAGIHPHDAARATEADFADLIAEGGEMVEPLRNIAFFARVSLDGLSMMESRLGQMASIWMPSRCIRT